MVATSSMTKDVEEEDFASLPRPNPTSPHRTDASSDGDDLSSFLKISLEEWERCLVDHFVFLKTLHEAGITSNISSESLRRYQLWLNLLVRRQSLNWSNENLVPPMDIAWLWHCHRLSPCHYQKHMEVLREEFPLCTNAGRNDTPTGELDDKTSLDPGSSLSTAYRVDATALDTWIKLFPNEPFILDTASRNNIHETEQAQIESEGQLLSGLDLLASAKRQAEFYWQIQIYFRTSKGSTNEYEFYIPDNDPKACLENAVRDYCRFLRLHEKYPETALVPTYPIDLLWHTHMTATPNELYLRDCRRVCGGKVLDHDDDFGKGDRQGDLGKAFERTAELWAKTYEDDSYLAKGGYRGPPPDDSYYPELPSPPLLLHLDDNGDAELARIQPIDLTPAQKETLSHNRFYLWFFLIAGEMFLLDDSYYPQRQNPSLRLHLEDNGDAELARIQPLASSGNKDLTPAQKDILSKNRLYFWVFFIAGEMLLLVFWASNTVDRPTAGMLQGILAFTGIFSWCCHCTEASMRCRLRGRDPSTIGGHGGGACGGGGGGGACGGGCGGGGGGCGGC